MNITQEGEKMKDLTKIVVDIETDNVKIITVPCTKDTIGCATEVKQPPVPDLPPGPIKL